MCRAMVTVSRQLITQVLFYRVSRFTNEETEAPRGTVACTRFPSVSEIHAQAVRLQGGSGCCGQKAAGWGPPEQTVEVSTSWGGGLAGLLRRQHRPRALQGGPGRGGSHPEQILSCSI